PRLGLQADALCTRADRDPLGLEDLADRLRHVLVLARDEARRHLDDRHARAEAPEHLGELEADVAPADHDQVLRHEVDVHQRLVGEVGDFVDPFQLRHQRPAADVEEDFFGLKDVPVDLNRGSVLEARMTLDHARALQPAHPLLQGAARTGDDLVLARFDPLHIHSGFSTHRYAVLGGSLGKARGVGARHHGLGGRAAIVHAGAAELVALDHGDFHPGAREARGERRPGLAGADDDGVEAGSHIGELSRIARIPITATKNIFPPVKRAGVPPDYAAADRVGGRILGRPTMKLVNLLSLPALALAGALTLGLSSGALADGRELFVTSAVEHPDDTATLPLYRGTSRGRTVWYILLDSSDGNEAQRRGINQSNKLANARNTGAVQKVTVQNGVIEFPASVDFTFNHEVVP